MLTCFVPPADGEADGLVAAVALAEAAGAEVAAADAVAACVPVAAGADVVATVAVGAGGLVAGAPVEHAARSIEPVITAARRQIVERAIVLSSGARWIRCMDRDIRVNLLWSKPALASPAPSPLG